MIKENTKANIKPGYKKTPVGIIPEDWEVKRLGEIGLPKMCKRIFKEQTNTNEGIPFYKIGTFGGVPDAFITKELFDEYKERYSFPKKGDILISAAGTIGRLVVYDGVPAYFQDSNIVWIDNNEELISNKLLYYIYSIVRWQKTEGGIVSRLYNSDLKKVKLPIPPLPEQKAIADCLSTWDKGIEKLSALIASKKEQKKGLMQGLFSGELKVENGELVKVEDEKLWLKGWKEVRLGEMFKQVKRPINWDDNEYYKLISIRRRSGGIFHRETLKGEEIRTKNLYDVKEGDFLISKMQVLHGASAIVSKENEGMKVSGSYITLVPKKPKTINMSFFKYFSTQPYFYHLTYRSSYGVHIEKMTFKLELLYKEKITIPSYNEQYAIAKILQVVDKEIELLEKKLEAFKIQKKGLMQVLLTGEKRLLVNS